MARAIHQTLEIAEEEGRSTLKARREATCAAEADVPRRTSGQRMDNAIPTRKRRTPTQRKNAEETALIRENCSEGFQHMGNNACGTEWESERQT